MTNNIKVDSSLFAIMKLDSSTNNVFKIFNSLTPTELTTDDLKKIEMILLSFTNSYNPEMEKRFKEAKATYSESKIDKKHFIIDLDRYRRQYYATTNKKGEKEVWVNCFCDNWGKNWRKELIFVLDGGNCYFNLKINLTSGKYYDLMVNGDA